MSFSSKSIAGKVGVIFPMFRRVPLRKMPRTIYSPGHSTELDRWAAVSSSAFKQGFQVLEGKETEINGHASTWQAGLSVTLPTLQARMVFPTVPRVPYPTGVQVPCAACASARADADAPPPRLGMPDRFPDDPRPLCLPCWRREEQRRQRVADQVLLERYWDQVGGVDVVEPLPAGDEPCPACGQPEPGPTCWLCSYTWLAQARQQYEADLELSSLEVDHQFEALATASQKRWQLDDLTGWADRLRMVVEAYAVHGRRGRAVELLADLLARDAAARTTMRGRPSTLARIAGVLAVDADWQSGRRAMPGRDRSAQFAGCTPESVTHMWRRCEALEWADIVVVGGRNTMDERIRFGRTNRRSEWNLMPLHTSTVPSADRAAQIPRALAVLGDLLQRALQLIDEATDELETALARAERWIDWPERVAAIQRRQAMARLVDDLIGQNLFRAHSVSRGEYVSSCSVVGLQYSRPSMIDSVGVGLEPAERRGRASGASRSSRGGDAQRRKRPVWEKWAYRLGRDLTSIWPWLARSPQYWVAATLGAALGPDWTAQQVIDLIRQRCGPPAPAETIHAPAAYLRELLRCALRTGQAALHEARAESEQRRAAVAADRERLRAQQQQTRDADAAQRAAAAAATGTGRAAAREAAAAAARAAARRAAAPPVGRARISGPTMPVESWPDVIQLGSGHREGQDPASNEIMKREDYPQ